MSYTDQNAMSLNPDLLGRIAACAANQELPFHPLTGRRDPREWAARNSLRITGQPGWTDLWAAALVDETPRPGQDESVISDAMILTAVQAVLDGTVG